ncbi:hypothetical protein CCR90_00800 [Rhodovulum sulfidophilum]|nr:hypothetical protein [Rhodovulum sulfidophilum]
MDHRSEIDGFHALDCPADPVFRKLRPGQVSADLRALTRMAGRLALTSLVTLLWRPPVPAAQGDADRRCVHAERKGGFRHHFSHASGPDAGPA